MITNREIGKLARAICKREGLKYGVRTNSYSEYRGGRRVKKYWMAFDSKRIANIFLEEVKPYGINPISKGYSYRIGYIVEIIKEVETGSVGSLDIINTNIPPWVMLLLILGWLLPTPTEIGRGIMNFILTLFGRKDNFYGDGY